MNQAPNPLMALAMMLAQHGQGSPNGPGLPNGPALRPRRAQKHPLSHAMAQMIANPRAVKSIHGTPTGKPADARINQGLP